MQFKSSLSIVALMSVLALTLPLKAELTGYWPFDGDLKDASASHNDAVNKTGKPGFTAEVPKAIKSSKALSLADKATLTIPNKPGLLDGQAMTLSLWINSQPDAPGLWARPISKVGRDGKTTTGLELQRAAKTGGLAYRIDTPAQNNQNGHIGNILDGTWHHIAITIDKNRLTTYVDGKAYQHRIKITGTLANPADLIIGQSCIENARFFTGMIDDLAIWDTALTAKQIKSLADGSKTPMAIK